MTEREQVEMEITDTKARILRSWRKLDGFDLSLEKRVAEITKVEADNRFLAALLTRLGELRSSA